MDPATDRRIGRAALVITLLSLAIVAVTTAIALWPRGRVEIPVAWRSQSNYTLIIFGRTSCPACAASAEFHRELAAAAGARGIRVIAAATSSEEDPATFAASIGLAPDHGIAASPAPKNLHTVPTIVVINRRGDVLRTETGALSDEGRKALLSLLAELR